MWLTPKPDPQFAEKSAALCAVYRTAQSPPQDGQEEVRALSID